VQRLQRDFDPVFYVPLRVKRILTEWGITKVEEKDWWDAADVSGVSIVCTPAQHTSRRGFFDVDTTLWCGWLISGADETVFFAGDTGYFPAFGEIRERSPRQIDVAVLPIGAYEPRWFMRYMHMDPADALRAYRDLDARFFAAMHWGAFDVTDEPLEEPPVKLLHAAESFGVPGDAVWLFAMGETRVIP
jgi:N-acyl-phosphatidylethanolamine-hydrolysing phospholipase D